MGPGEPLSGVDFLSPLCTEFFEVNGRVAPVLDHFQSWKISGWEKWIQFELMWFLEKKEGKISRLDKEYGFSADKRKSNGKRVIRADLVFCEGGHENRGLIVLEIKHSHGFEKCIEGMVDDAVNLEALKGSEKSNGRSQLYLGVHEKVAKERVKELLEQHCENQDWEFPDFESSPIGSTGLSWTVFGWDAFD